MVDYFQPLAIQLHKTSKAHKKKLHTSVCCMVPDLTAPDCTLILYFGAVRCAKAVRIRLFILLLRRFLSEVSLRGLNRVFVTNIARKRLSM